jgi:uncharacterized protein
MGPAVLGVGMVHAPGLEPVLEAGGDLIDVIEIEPQLRRAPDGRYQLDDGLFAAAERFGQPKLIHGVGFPVGGTHCPDAADLGPFAAAIERTAPAWASEHLSFNKASVGGREFFGGFLLPPVQTMRAARIAAGNIRAIKDLLPVPFAFETGVNYLTPQPGEMPDGAFFAAVAEQADCGILLDLHNLWCNERNGRQRVLDVVAELPLDRVWEVHLAGGSEVDGLWLDAHSGAPPQPLYELAGQVLPSLPNLGAVIFEITPEVLDRISTAEIMDQLRRIRLLWDQAAGARAARARAAGARAPGAGAAGAAAAGAAAAQGARRQRITAGMPTAAPGTASATPGKTAAADRVPLPGQWEAALAALTANVPGLTAAARAECGDAVDVIAADRCMPTLRALVKSFRDGLIATVMPLTFRMIMFHGGEQAFHDLLGGFRRENPPTRFLAEELGPILDYLRARGDTIPHLGEVAAYELAARRVRETGVEETVRFSCEPIALLSSLAEYRAPQPAAIAEYELIITSRPEQAPASPAAARGVGRT